MSNNNNNKDSLKNKFKFLKFGNEVSLELVKALIIGGILYVLHSVVETILELLPKAYSALYSYLIVLLILIFIYVSIRTFQKIRQNKGHSFPAIDNDFTIKYATVIHKIVNKKEFVHTRTYTLTALRDGLAKYKDQFNWTGNKYQMSCTKPGQRYVELPRVDSYSGYEIFFGHVPRKNDDIEVEVLWKLHDDDMVSVPFVCKTIYEPTETLKMVLEVPKGLGIKQVICQECFRNKCSIPTNTEIIDVPESGIVVWEPPNPKLMYNYEMKWHYGN